MAVDRMDPKNYGPNKYGEHITWLGTRLVLHGFSKYYRYGPGPRWGEADRLNVRDFQLAQGWRGDDADGYPGRESLKRLAAEPVGVGLPADVLDLTHWKLTLPIGEEESPKEIKQPTLDIYSSDKYFHTVAGGGVAFRAPVDGVTTSKSGYPRTELREMWVDGRYENARWSMKDGTHVMKISQAVTHWPDGKREVVAGQIHDNIDDICMIRIVGMNDDYAHIFAEKSLGKSKGSTKYLMYDNYKRGTRFNIGIVANAEGVWVYYNNVLSAHWPQQSWSDDKNYFKAGCYTQANESNGSGLGEVVVYSVEVEHRD